MVWLKWYNAEAFAAADAVLAADGKIDLVNLAHKAVEAK